jgi:hypothetical protein
MKSDGNTRGEDEPPPVVLVTGTTSGVGKPDVRWLYDEVVNEEGSSRISDTVGIIHVASDSFCRTKARPGLSVSAFKYWFSASDGRRSMVVCERLRSKVRTAVEPYLCVAPRLENS